MSTQESEKGSSFMVDIQQFTPTYFIESNSYAQSWPSGQYTIEPTSGMSQDIAQNQVELELQQQQMTCPESQQFLQFERSQYISQSGQSKSFSIMSMSSASRNKMDTSINKSLHPGYKDQLKLDLTIQEYKTLSVVRNFFHKYRVNSMYQETLLSSMRQEDYKTLKQLIKKGYVKQIVNSTHKLRQNQKKPGFSKKILTIQNCF